MKLIVIFSTDSLEEKTTRRQSKKINLSNSRHQVLNSRKVKILTHSQRSCNPDTSKLHQMINTLKASNLLVMIDLRARIYQQSRIEIQGRLNAKEPPKLVLNNSSQVKRDQWIKVSKAKNHRTNQPMKAKIHKNLRLQP